MQLEAAGRAGTLTMLECSSEYYGVEVDVTEQGSVQEMILLVFGVMYV